MEKEEIFNCDGCNHHFYPENLTNYRGELLCQGCLWETKAGMKIWGISK